MYKPWTITIDDGFCAYSYQLDLGGEVAIYDVAKAIAEKYNVSLPEGKHIKDGRINEQLYGPASPVPA